MPGRGGTYETRVTWSWYVPGRGGTYETREDLVLYVPGRGGTYETREWTGHGTCLVGAVRTRRESALVRAWSGRYVRDKRVDLVLVRAWSGRYVRDERVVLYVPGRGGTYETRVVMVRALSGRHDR